MPDDIFDIVDENDRVVGSAPRSEVHAKGLLHRSAHVLIFSDSGGGRKILLQKRSKFKDSHPGIYTTSCSGHVDSGETYDEGAVREMREETGVRVSPSDLLKIGKIRACRDTGNEFSYVYELKIPESAPLEFPPEEVESLDWVYVADFEKSLSGHPEKFTPAFARVYEFYKERAGGARQNQKSK
ncbi:MAG: hypothetical protein BHW65_00720 [Verrucomicrobia bacterium CAG:312_58_20]|nr:MAG: hypothetical protein BHW65_00720 [Verrucomicrobia bacterium CAG:312_58_20]